ncbi:MAG TPA: DUF2782 domain-containing protein [Mariprofundaceae bacterium]|nr:DUF2782 domain-containing protein [Mariprofundaceae bacterium]
MKFKLIFGCLLLSATTAHAQDEKSIDLREELSPKINNEQVEVRTYTHQDDGATITEYRSGGKVWMIKVQPAGDFPAYYLYDNEGHGTFEQRVAGNKKPSPPMWIIKSW